jgi:hypothetical protein
MDKETLEKLGGVVSKIGSGVERKWSDGNYGSAGKSFWGEVTLSPDANPTDAMNTLHSWLEGFIPANVPEANTGQTVTREDVEAHGEVAAGGEEEIIRAVFTEEPDEKFRLELYGNFGGKPSRWPVLKMVANRDAMFSILKPVFDDIGKPPADKSVNWSAAWKQGREKPDKPGEYYKDLVSLRKAE